MSELSAPTGILPHLIVRGGAQAIEFYRRAFGAELVFELPMPDGRVGHAELKLGSGRFMLADEAERWGFYNRVVAPEQLVEESLTLGRSLANGPSFAHAMTKMSLHQEWSMGIDEAIEAYRQAHKDGIYLKHLETVGNSFATRYRTAAPEGYDAFVKRVRG